jgi:hypothetical protein
VAQATTATVHREQEALVVTVVAARKTLDDDRFMDVGSNLTPPSLRPICASCRPTKHMIGGHDHLELSSPEYKQWCDLMLLTLHRYTLDDHILFDIADPSVYWARLDNIVVTWILNTLSPELHEIVREPTETAHQAWLTIEVWFLGNSESRILQLDARFRAFKQGDLSVSDYCHWMNYMAEDLRALGETITNRYLLLNLLQSLNKRFDYMKIFIKRLQSFSSFHTVRNDLELKEIELDH